MFGFGFAQATILHGFRSHLGFCFQYCSARPRLLKQLQDDPDLAAKYAAAFGEEPHLKTVWCLGVFLVRVIVAWLHLLTFG